jgi:hypothetical protein
LTITENTDRRLVIEHRPWALAGIVWVLGLLALYSGLTGVDMDGWAERLLVLALGIGTTAAARYFFAFLRITFDRDRGEVEHASLRPFGSRRKYVDLDRVRCAVIEWDWPNEGSGLTRLALETEDGRVQLEYGYGVGDRKPLERAVNVWLSRPG